MKALGQRSGQPGRQLDRALLALFGRMAKAGHHVHRLADGSFICAKYGMTRYCADIAELEHFAKKLGVLE